MDRQCGDTWTFFGLVKTRTPYRCDIRLRYSAYYIRCGYWCAPYQRRSYSSIDTHLPRLCLRNYHELVETESYPPCYRIIPPFPVSRYAPGCLPATGTFRTETLATIGLQLKRCNSNWEDTFFITLARNFGFGLNGDTFLRLGKPDSFTGIRQTSGWVISNRGLSSDRRWDCFKERPATKYLRLKKEYEYLSHKFGLTPMDVSQWRFLRLRQFPHIRIAQLAVLYHRSYGLLFAHHGSGNSNQSAWNPKGTSAYWVNHYTFRTPFAFPTKNIK